MVVALKIVTLAKLVASGLRINKTLFLEINSESQSSPAANLTYIPIRPRGKVHFEFSRTLVSKLTSFLARQP